MSNIRTQIGGLSAMTRQLEETAPASLRIITRLLALADGYGHGAPESDGSRGASELTSVETAADSRLALNDDLRAIQAAVVAAAAHVHAAIAILHAYTAPPPDMRCNGGSGQPGAHAWGRPDCTDIVEPGRQSGLCIACRRRRDRWKTKGEAA